MWDHLALLLKVMRMEDMLSMPYSRAVSLATSSSSNSSSILPASLR